MGYATLLKTVYADKVLYRALKHEKPVDTDRAHYITVATGRLEPYIRTLASTHVYIPASDQPIVSTQDGISFLHVYTTQLRMKADLYGALKTSRDMRKQSDFTQHTMPESVKNAVKHAQYLPVDEVTHAYPNYGLRIDPHAQTEITIEPHNFVRIQQLAQGVATSDALTAIGTETLSAHEPTHFDECDKTLSATVPQDFHLRKTYVTLQGVGGKTWTIYFLASGDTHSPEFRGLPADLYELCEKSVPADRIIVNPLCPGWQRDILWEHRAYSVPLVNKNVDE